MSLPTVDYYAPLLEGMEVTVVSTGPVKGGHTFLNIENPTSG